ncbi:hypothetical protein WJX72_002654 [[Myrmecia] bisecta]|uniref:Uncharacterized protein n=1 Tax=[Myrmecia] bisecta TaxID=41462 RepID=A0AAW1PKX6_9CHLO
MAGRQQTSQTTEVQADPAVAYPFSNGSAEVHALPAKRGRGRPPKTATKGVEVPPMKRPRGRPPGTGKKQLAAAAAAQAAAGQGDASQEALTPSSNGTTHSSGSLQGSSNGTVQKSSSRRKKSVPMKAE